LTDNDIAKIWKILFSRQQAIGINNCPLKDEMQFHQKIYEIAGNNFILHFYELMQRFLYSPSINYESLF